MINFPKPITFSFVGQSVMKEINYLLSWNWLLRKVRLRVCGTELIGFNSETPAHYVDICIQSILLLLVYNDNRYRHIPTLLYMPSIRLRLFSHFPHWTTFRLSSIFGLCWHWVCVPLSIFVVGYHFAINIKSNLIHVCQLGWNSSLMCWANGYDAFSMNNEL